MGEHAQHVEEGVCEARSLCRGIKIRSMLVGDPKIIVMMQRRDDCHRELSQWVVGEVLHQTDELTVTGF